MMNTRIIDTRYSILQKCSWSLIDSVRLPYRRDWAPERQPDGIPIQLFQLFSKHIFRCNPANRRQGLLSPRAGSGYAFGFSGASRGFAIDLKRRIMYVMLIFKSWNLKNIILYHIIHKKDINIHNLPVNNLFVKWLPLNGIGVTGGNHLDFPWKSSHFFQWGFDSCWIRSYFI